MLIRANDIVEVIAGDDRGTRAKVLRVDGAAGKLVVEGVNRVYKHVRRSQQNPRGGRLSKEMPIRLSNVLAVCQSCARRPASAPLPGRRHQGTVLQEVRGGQRADRPRQAALRQQVNPRKQPWSIKPRNP